ncbi:MAG: hypothetical protein AAF206_14540 [Bacteroidota bacterium]
MKFPERPYRFKQVFDRLSKVFPFGKDEFQDLLNRKDPGSKAGMTQVFGSRVSHLKGGTLIYTLLISSVISMLLAGYLIMNYAQASLLNRQYYQELAEDNLQSGLNLWLGSSVGTGHALSLQENWSQNLFDSDIDHCIIEPEPWGLLGLVHVTAKHGPAEASRSALIGRTLTGQQLLSFYLRDERQPLTLAGDARLVGNLSLPPAGIRSGRIGNAVFTGGKLFDGRVSDRRKSLPGLEIELLNPIFTELEKLSPAIDPNRYILDGFSEAHPWSEETKIYETTGSYEVRSVAIKGKCLIKAADEIIIGPDAKLEHCILMARKIRIRSGFRGSLQVFAKESVIVEAGVELSYPSVVMVQGRPDKSASCRIEANAKVSGSILFLPHLIREKPLRDDQCFVGPLAEIKGTLYASYHLDVRGTVQGHTTTGSLLVRTPAALFRNHLLDGKFVGVFRKTPLRNFVAPIIFPTEKHELIQWLEK